MFRQYKNQIGAKSRPSLRLNPTNKANESLPDTISNSSFNLHPSTFEMLKNNLSNTPETWRQVTPINAETSIFNMEQLKSDLRKELGFVNPLVSEQNVPVVEKNVLDTEKDYWKWMISDLEKRIGILELNLQQMSKKVAKAKSTPETTEEVTPETTEEVTPETTVEATLGAKAEVKLEDVVEVILETKTEAKETETTPEAEDTEETIPDATVQKIDQLTVEIQKIQANITDFELRIDISRSDSSFFYATVNIEKLPLFTSVSSTESYQHLEFGERVIVFGRGDLIGSSQFRKVKRLYEDGSIVEHFVVFQAENGPNFTRLSIFP